MAKPAFTKPRFELLAEIHEKRSRTIAESYPPGQWLVAQGYATLTTGSFGSTTLAITESGDAAYEQFRSKFEDEPAGPKP
jgi:hypothetical protein